MSIITDELLDRYEAGHYENNLLIIDPNTRQISIPKHEEILGVVDDAYSETKYFGVPRQVTSNVDISESIIYVAWQSEEDTSNLGITICTDYSFSEDKCVFGWLIPESVCNISGGVSFNVHFHNKKAEWHTTLAYGHVLNGNIVMDSTLDDDYEGFVDKNSLEWMYDQINRLTSLCYDITPEVIDEIFETN